MATSSRARSGVCSRTARTAATASATVATTASSSSAASVATRPSRNIGWSSATTIRIASVMLIARSFGQRQECPDVSPALGAGFQFQPAAEQLGPFAHTGQPKVSLDWALPDVEAGTLVTHFGHEVAITRVDDPDSDASSLAMASRVGKGLRQDAVEGDLDGKRRSTGDPFHVDSRACSGLALVVDYSPSHDFGRRGSFQLGRAQPRGDGSHIAERIGKRSADASKFLVATLACLFQTALNGVQAQHRKGQGLTRPVVQVRADAAPLKFLEGSRPRCA